MTEAMLSELQELARSGRQTDNQNFRMTDLSAVARTLREYGHPDCENKQIKSKWNELKAMWKDWCAHLQHVSGWGADDDGVPCSTREIEDGHFLANKQCRPFRGKAPMCRDQLEDLLGECAAGGLQALSLDNAIAAAEDITGLEEEEEDAEDLTQNTNSATQSSSTPLSRRSRETSAHPTSASARPSALRSHARDDQTSIAMARSVEKTAEALARLAEAHSQPVQIQSASEQADSSVTQAMRRLSIQPFWSAWPPSHRLSVMKALSGGSHADVIIGARDEDLELFAGSLCLL